MDEYSGLKSLYVPGYRLNESQPTPLPMGELYQFARAAHEGVNAGVSPLAKTLFPGKVLHEGRADAGTNEANLDNRNARAVYYDVNNRLLEDPIISDYTRASLYPAAVEDKLAISKRTGIPFERVWNGTGRSELSGRTGAQHAQRAAVHESAVKDPRNTAYLDYITRAQTGQTTARENLAAMYGTNNRGLLSVFNNPAEEQKTINKYLGKAQFDIPENEVNAFLKHPANLAMAYVDRSGIEFPKKPADWEKPQYKDTKDGRIMVKGSPTYQERMNQYNDFKELKDFEARYPQAKAYLDQRMGKTPEGLKQQNAFMTWLLDHQILVRDKSQK